MWIQIDRCVHSGKLRTEQTAQVLAAAVGPASVEARDGLAPNDPIGPVFDWLSEQSGTDSLAVVGHLPFLDRMASALVAGDQDARLIEFQMGGLVKLVPKPERAGYAVAWVLAPDIA